MTSVLDQKSVDAKSTHIELHRTNPKCYLIRNMTWPNLTRHVLESN